MSFSDKYNDIYKLVQDEIKEVQKYILESLEDVSEFKEELRKFVMLPAKHIRALVSFLYLKASGVNINDRQIIFQAIVELIHDASLIHDDVIDDAKVRRGEKSFNSDFGNQLSVIGGDLLLSVALKNIAKLDNPEILKMFANTFSYMCYGEIRQQIDKFKIPTIESYIEKTYNKTGKLFECALKGALLLENNTKDSKAELFAKTFGIAYQIRDDIKGILECCDNFDIKNGIYTAIVIYSGSVEYSLSGIEKAKSLLDNYLMEAREALADLQDSIYKTALMNLLELLNE